MRKNLRKIFVNFIFFPITVLALVSYIYFSYNPQDFPQSALAYFEKSQPTGKIKNSFCEKSKASELNPEFIRAINLAKQRLTEAGTNSTFLEELVDCVEISYSTLNYKTSGNKIEGKFEALEDNSNNLVKISIDQSYQKKDDLLLAFVLTHELIHAKQFFDFQKNWKMKDCIEREVEAFYMELDLFTALNDEERASLLARIKFGQSPDSTLTSLNQLIKNSIASAEACKKLSEDKLVQCFQDNNLRSIRNVLLLNNNYIAQCNS